MYPSTPQPTNYSTPSPASDFGSQQPPSPNRSHKKMFIIAGIILMALLIGAGGFSYLAIVNHNRQLAAKAKLEADKKAKASSLAKARQGTVGELKRSLDGEFKQVEDLNDRTAYNLGDGLKREAEAAATVGTGNENGL